MTPAPARRALAAAVLAASALTVTACHSAPGPAACPSGQQWEAVHGSWQCSSGPDPATDACPPGKVLTFAPGKPLECSGKDAP